MFIFASIAQLVERLPCKQNVVGSKPTWSSTLLFGEINIQKEVTTINEYDLEKAIIKSNKILKEKSLAIKAREKRKLKIKEKKYLSAIKVSENDNEI